MQNNFTRLKLLAVCLMFLLQELNIVQGTSNSRIRHKRFVCPSDGKWPDDTDCGKYHTCQGSSDQSGWCGPGMSFDVENQRCEMALAINCKDGDRPDWKPPDNWQGKTKMTTTTTKKSAQTDKPNKPDPSSGGGQNKVNDGMKEGDMCSFTGLQPDKENCQSYFYCKENEARKETCADKQLFDDEAKGCKEFKDVYCGDRPVNDKGKDQCRSRPNGVYPNLETACQDFYQCANQKKVKSGDCPQSLKFNILTLRCDRPGNVPAPCGTRVMVNAGGKLVFANAFFLTLFYTFKSLIF